MFQKKNKTPGEAKAGPTQSELRNTATRVVTVSFSNRGGQLQLKASAAASDTIQAVLADLGEAPCVFDNSQYVVKVKGGSYIFGPVSFFADIVEHIMNCGYTLLSQTAQSPCESSLIMYWTFLKNEMK